MREMLRVYVISPAGVPEAALVAQVKQALSGGATCLQLRDKQMPSRQRLERARRVHRLTQAAAVPLIINDRVDIAMAAGAEGVHLGQDDLPCVEVRKMVGASLIIGVSAETVDEARRAERDGADYLGVGPMFATATKDDAGQPVGPGRLKLIQAAVDLLCVGIGGITLDRVDRVIAAGARGVAVISAVFGAADPRQAVIQLRQAVERSLGS